jgi:hypothetical protein
MSTTQLFAELLVTGTGVVIWLAFLLAWGFRLSFQDITANATVFTLAPIVAVAYVLGIVMDRLGYSLFRGWERRLRGGIVDSKRTPPIEDRERYVLTNSEELGLQTTYNRSRLRICRSWVINFILIAVSSALWGYSLDPNTALYLPAASVSLGLVTLFVWARLVTDHYRNILASYDYLKAYAAPEHQD